MIVAWSATLGSEERGTGEFTPSIALSWGILAILEQSTSARTQSCAIIVITSHLILWFILVLRPIER
jgi:hypothetical protein